MVGETVRAVVDTVGAIVYVAAYPVAWVIWNAAGKHVVRAFEDVKHRSFRSDADHVVEEVADLPSLQYLLICAYYNKCVEEFKCSRSV